MASQVFSSGHVLGPGITRNIMPGSLTVQHSSFRSLFVPFSSSTSSCSNMQIVNGRGLNCGRQRFCFKGSTKSNVVGEPDFSEKRDEKTVLDFLAKRDEVTTENSQVSQENQLLKPNQRPPPGRLSRSEMIEVCSIAIQVLLDRIDPNRDWNSSRRSSSEQRKIEVPKEDRIERDFDPGLSSIWTKAVFAFGIDLLDGALLTMEPILKEVVEEGQRKSHEKVKQKTAPVPSHKVLLPPQQLNHSWISTDSVPTQRLQVVPKEQLAVGKRVLYRDHSLASGDGVWRHGIWDGDAVIHVEMPRCNCAKCAAAAEFNKEYMPRFKKGDHLFSQCENNALGKPMFHQGIYDGKGYVYHFADDREKTDCDYEKCEECVARGTHRRLNLKARGLGPSGVRKSCLSCFSEGAKIDLVSNHVRVYPFQWMAARLVRNLWKNFPFPKWAQNSHITEAGRVKRLTRLMKIFTTSGAEVVVNKAKTFYENNSFGEYSYLTLGVPHNCESFSYYCKTGTYGSPQITSVLDKSSSKTTIRNDLRVSVTILMSVSGITAILFLWGKGMISRAKQNAKKANEKYPHLVPSALVPAEVYRPLIVTREHRADCIRCLTICRCQSTRTLTLCFLFCKD